MTSKGNSDQWHWDNDRHRWVYMGSNPSLNPTYRWELRRGKMVYENDLMMEAIDVACANMSSFPDANLLISQIKRNLDNDRST